VAQTLTRRGITSPEAARAFLDPAHYDPAPATALPGMEMAVARLLSAIRAREHICVWGDFDVDGQTVTALLVQTLRALGADVTYHIPVRSRESHGVNVPYLKEAIDLGAQLVLTCDTGITAHEACDYARSRSVDMVITDHHDLPPRLPIARAVVNPKMLPVEHPLATLAGVGVAYKLAEELIKQSAADFQPPELLDLVALGLVADLALLQGETRYLVQKGLEALRSTPRAGLHALFELADLEPETLNESHIGFAIAPRLNALGRLGDANPIVDFLLTTDPVRARVLAAQLENYNAQRQLLTDQVTQAAESLLRADPSLLAAPILIVGHPTWPGGIVGIAAARLVERYSKPAVIFSTPPDEPARGSARSVEGLNITEAIAAQSDLLLNFGGHPMAAGLSLAPENLQIFYKRMVRTVEKLLEETQKEPTLEIDTWLSLPDLTLDLAAAIEQISPFGPGNPRLILASRNLTLENAAPLGRNKEHLKLTVADEAGSKQQVLWWDGGSEDPPSGKFDLAYTLRASDWRGSRQVQLEFVGFRIVEAEVAEAISRKVEVVDYRTAKDLQRVLTAAQGQPSTLIWAEGDEKGRMNGKDRNEFTPADRLVIWTIPPSPEEFRAALETIQPKTVWLTAAHPPQETTDNFIARLTGLLKYAIAHRNGQVTYLQLATATAQRLITVRKGLAWLVAHGTIEIKEETDGELTVAASTSIKDPAGAARLWVEVQSLLAESAAYRAHFKRADKDTLFL
jgi:single-stranded-DNA-specific exonuclease